MAKYRKKPVVIEAVRLMGGAASVKECLEFIGQIVDLSSRVNADKFDEYVEIVNKCGLSIETLEGDMLANIGDYIIKGVNGEFYPCKPDIFAKTYERVEG